MKVVRQRLERCHPGALGSLRAGEIDAIVVEALYDEATLARVATALATPEMTARLAPRDHADPAVPQVRVIGEPISPSMRVPQGPPLAHYFGQADAFRALCRALFAPAPPFFEHVLAALTALAGIPASLPTPRYGWGTFRHVPPGCGLDLHCEGLYADIEALAPIATSVELEETISLFMPIVAPEGGGVLEVFGTARPAADEPPALRLAPAAGELVLFAGGRRYHRVTPVEGERARWTIGAFAAYARDGERVHAWG